MVHHYLKMMQVDYENEVEENLTSFLFILIMMHQPIEIDEREGPLYYK
jgi:hypothetical protein